MLFIQFSGEARDIDNNSISNFRIKGYHQTTNTWSDWYYNNKGKYSLNMGDAQWLTQDGSVDNNDRVMLLAETLEDNIFSRRFCFIVITLDKTKSTYINNIQLLPNQKSDITGNYWFESKTDGSSNIFDETLNKSIYQGRVNEIIKFKDVINDSYYWVYDDVIHRHTRTYLGTDTFSDRIGIDKILINWDGNNNITSLIDDAYIYDSLPTVNDWYRIDITVINKAKLMTDATEYIKIRYNQPTMVLIHTPNNPTYTQQLTINTQYDIPDNNVVETKYYINEILVSDTLDVDFTITKDMKDIFKENISMSLEYTWDDGYETHKEVYNNIIETTNIPLTFDLKKEINDGTLTISPINVVDIDGDIEDVKFDWKVYYKTPIDDIFKLVQHMGFPDEPHIGSKEWVLTKPGEYKITATGLDAGGDITIKEITHNIENDTTVVINERKINYVEWE